MPAITACSVVAGGRTRVERRAGRALGSVQYGWYSFYVKTFRLDVSIAFGGCLGGVWVLPSGGVGLIVGALNGRRRRTDPPTPDGIDFTITPAVVPGNQRAVLLCLCAHEIVSGARCL